MKSGRFWCGFYLGVFLERAVGENDIFVGAALPAAGAEVFEEAIELVSGLIDGAATGAFAPFVGGICG